MAERQTTATIPKIDPPLAKHPSNYPFWKAKAVPLLKHLKLWDIVSLKVPTPVIPILREDQVVRGQRVNQNGNLAANAAEVEILIRGNAEEVEQAEADAREWNEKNTFATLVILNGVDVSCANMLAGLDLASDMWTKLSNHFCPKTTAEIASTLALMSTYEATEELNMTDWTSDMLNLKLKHEAQGGEMLDSTFGALLLINLPKTPTWTSFIQVTSNTGFQNSDALISLINAEYERLNAKDPDKLSSVYSARTKANKRRANSVSASPTVAAAGGSYRRSRSAGPSQPSICSNCHRIGHLPADCFDKGGGKEGQFPKAWDEARIARWKETGEKRRSGDRNKRTAQVESIAESNEDESFTVVCFVAVPSICAANAAAPKSDKWNHDSCSTDHVAWDRNDFSEYHEITPILVEGFDKSMSIEAIGRGKVKLVADYNGKKTTMELTDVLHMPGARNNLVSGVRLAKIGVSSNLNTDGVTLVHDKSKRVICSGKLRTFFELDVKVVRDPNAVPTPSISATKTMPSDFGIVGWGT